MRAEEDEGEKEKGKPRGGGIERGTEEEAGGNGAEEV